MTTDTSDSEVARLEALSSYTILDSLPEEDYDAITRIASQLCGMPISLITLLDDHRQWFKSAIGMVDRQTPREYAFCDHAIRTPDQLMEVPDARLDSRFADNPLTTRDPHVIFYAGVPLVDEEGHALGTLCVIDNKPNKLTDQQASALRSLARQVVTLLKLRRNQVLLEAANEKLRVLNAEADHTNQVLQAVVNNGPTGFVLWQVIRAGGRIVDFRYMFTNAVNAALTGRSVTEMTGNTLLTLFPGVVASGVFDRLVAAADRQQPQQYEQHYQLDQVDVWGSFSIIPLGDKLLFTYQDIGPLKETEEKLRAHTENLEQLVADRTTEVVQLSALQNAILEHAGFAIISTDGQGMIQTVNPATLHLLGYQTDELVGKRDVSTLYHPVALADTAQALGSRLGHAVPATFSLFKLIRSDRSYECVMIDKNGRHIPVLLITTPLRDKAGLTSGYVMMVTDITALKTARAELQQRNQELNTFFEVALDLHCIATIDGTILKVNRAWETTLGYTTGELLRMNHFDLIHPSDRAATEFVLSDSMPLHTYANHTNRFRRKDGTYRIIEWNVVAVAGLLYASARDITDRQQADRQLKKLNQRLQLATKAAGQGIWDYNREHDLLTWDEQMCAIHGLPYTGAPMRLHDYLALIHPDDLPAFLQRNTHDPAEGSYVNERRIIRPDGQMRYTELHGIQTLNRAGQSLGSVGVARDITDRKNAEVALRQSERNYRELVDNLKEVVYQTNQQGELTFLNPFWTAITGYTIGESLGQPFYAYVSPPAQTRSKNRFADFMTNHKPATRLVLRYRHKSGKDCWAEVFAQVLTTDAGQAIGLTGTITDITERKQALDDLRHSEQRFRDIAENINEIFWIHAAPSMQLLYINPAYELITGLPARELADNPLAFMGRVDAGDQPLLTAAFEQYKRGEAMNVQFRAKNAQHDLRWFDIRSFVKKSPAGTPLNYIGIATDITGQKEKEVVLQQSLAREQELNRLKSQFVSTASHEFRTPLATIQSSVDLIKLYIDRPPATAQPAVQRHLGIIEKEIANFGGLLSDILTLGKIEAGKIPFSPQWLALPALAERVIATHFGERTDGRTVQVAVTGPPRPIFADEKLIGHALVNLLSNAFKFSATNPALHLDFTTDQVRVAVSDRGIGIPADELVHLFETFFRARNAVNIQGSGLGLVITRQFVERHGGQLTLTSEEQEGTTCTIILPA